MVWWKVHVRQSSANNGTLDWWANLPINTLDSISFLLSRVCIVRHFSIMPLYASVCSQRVGNCLKRLNIEHFATFPVSAFNQYWITFYLCACRKQTVSRPTSIQIRYRLPAGFSNELVPLHVVLSNLLWWNWTRAVDDKSKISVQFRWTMAFIDANSSVPSSGLKLKIKALTSSNVFGGIK